MLPELKVARRRRPARPVPTGSATDLTFEAGRETTVEEVNAAVKAAAEGPMKGYLRYTEDQSITSALRRTRPPASSMPAPDQGDRQPGEGRSGWYDNEWGYSNRLVDLIGIVGKSLCDHLGSRHECTVFRGVSVHS